MGIMKLPLNALFILSGNLYNVETRKLMYSFFPSDAAANHVAGHREQAHFSER